MRDRGEIYSSEEFEKMIAKMIGKQEKGVEYNISKSMFGEFMLSTRANNIIDSSLTQVDENQMSMNLACYFCYSSHNTYLSGN